MKLVNQNSLGNVLVTGGAGYIGSHAVRVLCDQGYNVTVLDDLSHGHRPAVDSRAKLILGSTGDADIVRAVLKDEQIESVIHFAANIEVAESVTDPAKYYENNFSNSITLMKCMVECKVLKLVFSSTAAVYGNPEKTPISEDQPLNPINPYGRSKLMTEMAIQDFSTAYGLGYAILRYFNVAGAHPDGSIGEAHEPESHLIPKILLAARDGQSVHVYGTDYPTPDGTCVRDYIHVLDLAKAHALAIQHIGPNRGCIFNLGSESGFSVRDVINACQRITGRKLKVEKHARRTGDPATLVASSNKIRQQLGWVRQYPSIEEIVEHAWNWHTGGGFKSNVLRTGDFGANL